VALTSDGRGSPDQVNAAVDALARDYDKHWATVDFAAISGLWERSEPVPIYVGDEYAAPLIGTREIDRHWGRLGARVRAASMFSEVHSCDVLAEGVVRCVLLCRWRLAARETEFERVGASWVTWLLVRRDDEYRVCHHMETQVYLGDDIAGSRETGGT
jgi:hypothetical protein